MAYLPTYCGQCDRVSLFPPESFDRHAVCSACGGPTRFIRGACYAAADVPLFFRLEAAVEAAELSDAQAYDILIDIDAIADDTAHCLAAFERAAQQCVELAEIRNALRVDPSRAVRALGMLATVLRARATPHRPHMRESGIKLTPAGRLAALAARRAKLK